MPRIAFDVGTTLVLGALACGVGCSTSPNSPAQTGGFPGAGGSVSTGGASSGFSGAGGSNATGGNNAMGGSNTGGATQTSGGKASSGGAATGSMSGAGGKAATDGAASGGTATGGTATGGAATGGTGGASSCALPSSFKWTTGAPVVLPKSDATHDLVAVKDPTIVRYDDRWHLFASTVTKAGAYNMAYLSFADWSEAGSAPFDARR